VRRTIPVWIASLCKVRPVLAKEVGDRDIVSVALPLAELAAEHKRNLIAMIGARLATPTFAGKKRVAIDIGRPPLPGRLGGQELSGRVESRVREPLLRQFPIIQRTIDRTRLARVLPMQNAIER